MALLRSGGVAAPALSPAVFWLLVGGLPSTFAVAEGTLLLQLRRSLAQSLRGLNPEPRSGEGTSAPPPGRSP
jgi:hypothetical protein